MHVVITQSAQCAIGIIEWSSVRPSVCLSCLSAAADGGFAAELRRGPEADVDRRGVRRILVRGVNALLPSKPKKIGKI